MKRRSSVVTPHERCVSPIIKRTKVQAQRKFAQGSNNYTYSTPKVVAKAPDYVFPSFQSGQQSSPEAEECELNNFSSLPTVDDFLTFLCFRETDVLPERLNYLNNPQFDVLPMKKKSSRSNNDVLSNKNNLAHSREQKGKKTKLKGSLKEKKLSEYKLRSHKLTSKTIVGKNLSCSLALKHNQRLRSKNISENKLQTLKSKNQTSSKLSSNVKKLLTIFPKGPLTRASSRSKSVQNITKAVDSFSRVTRRNSTFHKQPDTEPIVEKTKEIQCKKNATRKLSSDINVKKISIRMEDSRFLTKKPLPLSPAQKSSRAVSNSSNFKRKFPVKPITRNDQSNNSSFEEILCRSTRSNSVQLDESSNSRSNVLPHDGQIRSTRSNSVQLDDRTDYSVSNEESSYRSTRPSRKTKEAAALYMEMLGKELLCPDDGFDDEDDDMSVESFPDLPNAEEHMRREKELKELHQKKILENSTNRKVKLSLKSTSRTRESTPVKTLKESTHNIRRNSSVGAANINTELKRKESIENVPSADKSKTSISSKTSESDEIKNVTCTKSKYTKKRVTGKRKNNTSSACKILKKTSFSVPKIEKITTEPETSTDEEIKRKKKPTISLARLVCEAVKKHVEAPSPKGQRKNKLPCKIDEKKNVKISASRNGSVNKQFLKDRVVEKRSSRNVRNLKNKQLQQSGNRKEKLCVFNKAPSSRIEISIKDDGAFNKSVPCTTEKVHKMPIVVPKQVVIINNEMKNTNLQQSNHKSSSLRPQLLFNSTVEKEIMDSSILKPQSVIKVEEEKKILVPKNASILSPDIKNGDNEKKIFKKNTSYSSPEVNRKSEAFSADNENSVYAFEPDLPTTSPPFRHLKPNTPTKPTIGNSIAVQVNFENDVVECSSTGETQVSSTTDCGDRVFYIPIPTSTVPSTLGVALKLGTDGPNQKIIIGATLITNSPTFTTNTVTTTNMRNSSIEAVRTYAEIPKLSSQLTSTVCPQDQPSSSATSTTSKLPKQTLAITNSKVQSVKILKLNKNKRLNSLYHSKKSTSKMQMMSRSATNRGLEKRSKVKKIRTALDFNKVFSKDDSRQNMKAVSSSRTNTCSQKVSNQEQPVTKLNSPVFVDKVVFSRDNSTSIASKLSKSMHISESKVESSKLSKMSLNQRAEKLETTKKIFEKNIPSKLNIRRSSLIALDASTISISSSSSSAGELTINLITSSDEEEESKQKSMKRNSVVITSSNTFEELIKVPQMNVNRNEPNIGLLPNKQITLTQLTSSSLITSANSQQNDEVPCTSTSVTNKKRMVKENIAHSVKIVKVNKSKKNESASATEPLTIVEDKRKPEPIIINDEIKKRAEPIVDQDVKQKTEPTLNKEVKKKLKIEKAKTDVLAKLQLNKNKIMKKSTNSDTEEEQKKSRSASSGEILEAPTFHPTTEEFCDPLEYIEKISPIAEKFGLCRIVPPSHFRPDCKVNDGMRFTAYNQYVHKMLYRWGPNVKEMMAIKKFLATQNIQLTEAPRIGGMELDLPRLYQIVQQCGGLSAVIEKERWHMVADVMKIPKLAQDRITKLDDIYCKYLLPYDILSHEEREKLLRDIDKEWLAHLQTPNEDEIFEDIDECITKGKTTALSCFYRTARNTMMMCFEKASSTETIETEFWKYVSERRLHICVHCGSVDSGTEGYGFSMSKNSAFRKHPWNLKVLTNNQASILRFLGPIMGVTVPTLHFGMLYSTCCWYRDPHGFPWVEYLHTGANKIWYGVPDEHSDQFRAALLKLVPRYCRDKRIWLPSDTVMIPPPLLTAENVTLSRVVQEPGQFVVVFPKAFTSSISTGYIVSEIVYFAHASWLDSAKQIFADMQESGEPPVFSLEQLLICIAKDARASLFLLNKVLPFLTELKDTEISLRKQLKERGICTFERLNVNKKRKAKPSFQEEDYYECDMCHSNLYISMMENLIEPCNYCLTHAIAVLQKKSVLVKHCKILYLYTEEELEEIVDRVKSKIEMKSVKKLNTK